MALVLGAQLDDKFLLGQRQIRVRSIETPGCITIERDDGVKFAIGREAYTEVVAGVFIRLPLRPLTHRLRLMFEAPESIVISRLGGASAAPLTVD